MLTWQIGVRNKGTENAGGLRMELIYGGVLPPNTIRVIYREHTVNEIGQTTIAGYHAEYQYDLKTDSTLTFQDFELKVLEANRAFIYFKVISGPKRP